MTGGDLVVLAVAAAENGWTLRAIVEEPRGNWGYAAFEREQYPFPGKGWGTVLWRVSPTGPSSAFETGNYDMTRDEALADLVERSTT